MSMIIDGTNGLTYPGGQLEVGPLTAGTAQASTSGTSIDFTGIPSWVKRVFVMLNGVSTSGTSVFQIQLGSGSPTTSGYNSIGTGITGTTLSTVTNNTTGFGLVNEGGTAASLRVGLFIFTNISGNIWAASFQYALTDANRSLWGAGNVTLSGALDRVRLTTVNGTDTFDAGSINIMYE